MYNTCVHVPIATILKNSYNTPARLFVAGGGEISSDEGTTQGDPLSMVFYALATLPLVQALQVVHPTVRQTWYADDSGAGGQLTRLRGWWDSVEEQGKLYGYNTNPEKTLLLVKPEQEEEAYNMFAGTGIRIVTGATKYLGSYIGESDAVAEHVRRRVGEWIAELKALSDVARTEPHAAYAALTHGLRGRWTYLLRTVPFPADCLSQMDDMMRTVLIPAVTGREAFSDNEWAVLQLPTRLGGFAVPSLSQMANGALETSRKITSDQTLEILDQNDRSRPSISIEHAIHSAQRAKSAALAERLKHDEQRYMSAKETLTPLAARQLEHLSAKGVSSWLHTLPLREHGFSLSKCDFRDAIALRYGWPLRDVPEKCVCGQDFTAAHAMCCPTGGFPTIRHNEVRDMIADLVTEVSPDVSVEPLLAPLEGEVFRAASTNTAHDARSDVRIRGFWTRAQNTFLDIRVFHPDAASYAKKPIADLLLQHERQKKLQYNERIVNVDRGNFTPLVFTTAGSASPECLRFLKRLCAMLAQHDGKPYGEVMAYVRCRLSFALLRAAVMCIRGARSAYHRPVNALRPLAMAEGRM